MSETPFIEFPIFRPGVSLNAPRAQRILARCMVAILAVLGLVTTLELTARMLLPEMNSPVESAFPSGFLRRPTPYTMFSGTPGASLNEFGFRGPGPIMPKPPGELRVLLVGGSTVVEGDPTIAELLERLLVEQGAPGARVYNCGVVSSVSAQELARVVFDLSNLEADLIVSYNGGNDTLEPVSYDPRPGYPFNFLIHEGNPLLDRPDRSYPLFALAAFGSRFCRHFGTWRFVEHFGHLAQLREQSGWGTPEWEYRIAESYVQTMVKTKRVAGALGSEFLAFYQPTLAFKILRKGEEDRIDQSHPLPRRTSLAVRRHVRKLVSERPDDSTGWFVDISDVYRDESGQVFRDYIHTLQDAKPVIAQVMHQPVLAKLKGLSAASFPTTSRQPQPGCTAFTAAMATSKKRTDTGSPLEHP